MFFKIVQVLFYGSPILAVLLQPLKKYLNKKAEDKKTNNPASIDGGIFSYVSDKLDSLQFILMTIFVIGTYIITRLQLLKAFAAKLLLPLEYHVIFTLAVFLVIAICVFNHFKYSYNMFVELSNNLGDECLPVASHKVTFLSSILPIVVTASFLCFSIFHISPKNVYMITAAPVLSIALMSLSEFIMGVFYKIKCSVLRKAKYTNQFLPCSDEYLSELESQANLMLTSSSFFIFFLIFGMILYFLHC